MGRYLGKVMVAGPNPAEGSTIFQSFGDFLAKILKACWQSWSEDLTDQLYMKVSAEGIFAQGHIISDLFIASYSVSCDTSWATRKLNVEVEQKEKRKTLSLESNGMGMWTSNSQVMPHLGGAIDVDLSATPFTNTLPICRLNLKENQTQDIQVVYVTIPGLELSLKSQRYTCLVPFKRYYFEQPSDNFCQELLVDENGLIVAYPSLFKRVKC